MPSSEAHVPDEVEDVVKRMRLTQTITVATPEETKHIYAVEVDGLMQFVRLGVSLVPASLSPGVSAQVASRVQASYRREPPVFRC